MLSCPGYLSAGIYRWSSVYCGWSHKNRHMSGSPGWASCSPLQQCRNISNSDVFLCLQVTAGSWRPSRLSPWTTGSCTGSSHMDSPFRTTTLGSSTFRYSGMVISFLFESFFLSIQPVVINRIRDEERTRLFFFCSSGSLANGWTLWSMTDCPWKTGSCCSSTLLRAMNSGVHSWRKLTPSRFD